MGLTEGRATVASGAATPGAEAAAAATPADAALAEPALAAPPDPLAPSPEPAALAPTEPAAPPPPRPALGPSPGRILPSDTFATAGRKAMWPHVGRMLDREEALRDPTQTDALKRYRVATRRLRAAIRLFREAYPARDLKPLRKELADLATALGKVRDLDVRVEELDAWAREQPEGTAGTIEPLRAALAGQRRAAAAALLRKLDSKGHQRLLDRLVAFVGEQGSPDGLDQGEPERMIRDRAASGVWRAYEEVRAYVSVVRWADLPTLHGLRIHAKRLRYALEFLGDVLGPEREPLIERLVALQDHLGALNDADLAVAAVRSFLAQQHAALAPDQRAAIVGYLADRERLRTRMRRSVGRAWRPVVSATFGRRLGRAVVVRPAA